MTDEALAETGHRALLGRLVPGALHELANPLLALMGTTQVLIEDAESGPKMNERLATVRATADEIAVILRMLQGLARERMSPPQPLVLAAFTAETITIVRRLSLIRDVELDEAYNGDASLTARPADLRQAVASIALDALEACERGGRVEVILDGGRLRVSPAGRDEGDPLQEAVVRALGGRLEHDADAVTLSLHVA